MRTPLFVYRLHKRLWRLNLSLLTLALGLVLAAAAGLMLLLDSPGEPPAAVNAPAPAVEAQMVASVAPSGKLGGRMEAAAVEEMRQQPHADLSSLPVVELLPPLLSIDSTGFRRGEDIIRLDRVVGPRAGDVCFDGVQRWSCGLQARAALHNLVAGRSLLCQPRRALPDGGMSADCDLATKGALPGGDVARQLVGKGWARPMVGHEAAFSAELDQARAADAGLWRGGWQISTP